MAPASTSPSQAMSQRFGVRARLVDGVVLTKPRITMMAVIVAGGAMALSSARATTALLDAVGAALALLGIGMAVAGAGALNMFVERDVDALMARTATRPLPARRLPGAVGLVVGALLSLSSLPLLYVVAGPLTCALTAFSLFVYVLVYTPMKRKSPWALVVGAVPGAMPALMGAAAATHEIERVGVLLFGVVFLWQLPHFIAIGIYREREYVAAGHRLFSAPVADGGHGLRVGQWLVLTTAIALAALGVLLAALGVGGPIVLVAASLLGAWFVLESARFLWARQLRSAGARRADVDAWARRVFFSSLLYQTALFGALTVDAVAHRFL